jgi:hypothetical protein
MKKLKLIKKIAGITLIGGGMLTSLPFIMSSCGSGTTTKQYRFDGTN